jgi:hypothetical protein
MSQLSKRKLVFGTALAAMVALIAFVSFLPVGDKHVLHTRGRFHPLGHLLAFTAIGFAGAMTPKTFRNRFLFFLGLVLFAFGIELGEHLIFQMPMEWSDVLLDWLGVFSGLLLAFLFRPHADFSNRFGE